jgi:predicted O-linked N-acetylglucosamine transferase (SPINDLY family)
MRLLHQIDDSVLWLIGGNDNLEGNLRQEAENRGINSSRLIFASRIPYASYLARYQLADLFLDTFPFNAGTTASDALWAGLPLVTCPGETFVSRMAGSLLKAVGLPEMIAESVSAYEALACKLARDPDLMASFKRKLADNLPSCSLFNTQLFTSHIEAAYTAVYKRYQEDLSPTTIYVPK